MCVGGIRICKNKLPNRNAWIVSMWAMVREKFCCALDPLSITFLALDSFFEISLPVMSNPILFIFRKFWISTNEYIKHIQYAYHSIWNLISRSVQCKFFETAHANIENWRYLKMRGRNQNFEWKFDRFEKKRKFDRHLEKFSMNIAFHAYAILISIENIDRIM